MMNRAARVYPWGLVPCLTIACATDLAQDEGDPGTSSGFGNVSGMSTLSTTITTASEVDDTAGSSGSMVGTGAENDDDDDDDDGDDDDDDDDTAGTRGDDDDDTGTAGVATDTDGASEDGGSSEGGEESTGGAVAGSSDGGESSSDGGGSSSDGGSTTGSSSDGGGSTDDGGTTTGPRGTTGGFASTDDGGSTGSATDDGDTTGGFAETDGGSTGGESTDGGESTGPLFPSPLPGEVVISEIMQNPSFAPDPGGEWFEVVNITGQILSLEGCTVLGGTFDTGFAIDAPLILFPGGYATFANDSVDGPGFAPSFVYPASSFSLANGADEVSLQCGALVDRVAYDGGPGFPDPTSASMTLDSDFLDADLNDNGNLWCTALSVYNGDLGTPGADNDPCPGALPYDVEFCRLQFPLTIDEAVGTEVDVFGRVFIDGLTNLSGVTDPAPAVTGAVGYGPDGTDPAVDVGWVWTDAAPNEDYDPAAPAYEANNDEYQATLTVPGPPGDYDFAYRFTGDGGATLTYCDGDMPGNTNGYDPAQAGQLTSSDAGPANLIFSEYLEGSGDNKALEITNLGPIEPAFLTGCVVNIYFGTDPTPSTIIALDAVDLVIGESWVLCDVGIDPAATCDQLALVSFFNGDDEVELACDGTTIDTIGQLGADGVYVGSGAGATTQDATLRRDCSFGPDADFDDAFDPDEQWTAAPIDTFDDLGVGCP